MLRERNMNLEIIEPGNRSAPKRTAMHLGSHWHHFLAVRFRDRAFLYVVKSIRPGTIYCDLQEERLLVILLFGWLIDSFFVFVFIFELLVAQSLPYLVQERINYLLSWPYDLCLFVCFTFWVLLAYLFLPLFLRLRQGLPVYTQAGLKLMTTLPSQSPMNIWIFHLTLSSGDWSGHPEGRLRDDFEGRESTGQDV